MSNQNVMEMNSIKTLKELLNNISYILINNFNWQKIIILIDNKYGIFQTLSNSVVYDSETKTIIVDDLQIEFDLIKKLIKKGIKVDNSNFIIRLQNEHISKYFLPLKNIIEFTERQNIFIIPLNHRNKVLGAALLLNDSSILDIDDNIVNVIELFANQIALNIEHARLLGNEQRQKREIEILRQAALFITKSLDIDIVINHILKQMKQVVPFDSATVQILENNHLKIISCCGFSDEDIILGSIFNLDKNNPNKKVIESKCPYILNNAPSTYRSFRDEPRANNIHSWLGVPMIINEKVIGMISLDNISIDFYKENHSRLAFAFASQAAIAIENARLYEQAKNEINNRKIIEKALIESEKYYRSTIDSIPDYIHIIDRDLKITFINKAFIEWNNQLGISVNVIGKTVYETFPFLSENVLKEYEYVFETGKIHLSEDCVILKGEALTTVTHKIPVFKDKKVIQIITVIRDISNLKHFEETLANRNKFMDITMRSIHDGVISTDLDTNILFMNTAAEHLTGWTLEQSSDKPLCNIFKLINERNQLICNASIDKVRNIGELCFFSNNIFLLSMNGKKIMISASGAPIMGKNNLMIGFAIVFSDITEKSRMEQEIIKASKLESIGILAGGIAHDFNNILTAIMGNISLAKMEINSDNKIYSYLSDAEQASMHARDLTQQLLTFSKGGMPVKTLCSIQELIKESALFSLRGAKSKCQFDLPNDLWTIEADRGQISEVINNLIINADQSMPEGGIIDIKANNISITPNDHIHLNSGNYVKLSIEDHGIGINKEVIHNIYDPFFTTKQNGSGLGLTVVYSIISKHNGVISVESEVSNGTIFYIYLPACSKTINREKNTLEIVTGTGTILLMDDNKTIRNTTGKMLEQIGYNCDYASNGNELIDLYRTKINTGGYYDAVLMDLTIPGGMGGKEAAKILLEIDPNAKLIVSSGYASDPIMANYKNYGFSDVIAKPYEIKELSNVIRDVLRK